MQQEAYLILTIYFVSGIDETNTNELSIYSYLIRSQSKLNVELCINPRQCTKCKFKTKLVYINVESNPFLLSPLCVCGLHIKKKEEAMI